MFTSSFDASKFIVIDIKTKTLEFYQGSQLLHTFLVALGKNTTPTPQGTYQIATKIIQPGGILGSRWLGLTVSSGLYGIHGTNNPLSIGKFISNGCIRMYNQDIEKLFRLVTIGTPVKIVDDRTKLAPPASTPVELSSPAEPIIEPPTVPEMAVDFAEPQPEENLPCNQPPEIAPTIAPDPVAEVAIENQPPVSSPFNNIVTHVVQPGDTLWKISRNYGVPMHKLMQLNRLPNPNMIFPGQTILIPQNYY